MTELALETIPMILNLTPDTEARLRSIAEQRGQAPEEALIALLKQALAEAEADTEMLAELRASVEDHAAGRSMTIEEYRVKALVRRQERDARHVTNATPAPELVA